jgi:hypothetical protein
MCYGIHNWNWPKVKHIENLLWVSLINLTNLILFSQKPKNKIQQKKVYKIIVVLVQNQFLPSYINHKAGSPCFHLLCRYVTVTHSYPNFGI